MASDNTEEKEIKFETALKQLEEIVAKLEDGGLELEKSMELFEKGIGTAKALQKKLDSAGKKIEQLVKARDGSVGTTPFPDSGIGE